jgi:hypothetical protein
MCGECGCYQEWADDEINRQHEEDIQDFIDETLGDEKEDDDK